MKTTYTQNIREVQQNIMEEELERLAKKYWHSDSKEIFKDDIRWVFQQLLQAVVEDIEPLAINIDLGVNGMRKDFDKSETTELVKKIKSIKASYSK